MTKPTFDTASHLQPVAASAASAQMVWPSDDRDRKRSPHQCGVLTA